MLQSQIIPTILNLASLGVLGLELYYVRDRYVRDIYLFVFAVLTSVLLGLDLIFMFIPHLCLPLLSGVVACCFTCVEILREVEARLTLFTERRRIISSMDDDSNREQSSTEHVQDR